MFCKSGHLSILTYTNHWRTFKQFKEHYKVHTNEPLKLNTECWLYVLFNVETNLGPVLENVTIKHVSLYTFQINFTMAERLLVYIALFDLTTALFICSLQVSFEWKQIPNTFIAFLDLIILLSNVTITILVLWKRQNSVLISFNFKQLCWQTKISTK